MPEEAPTRMARHRHLSLRRHVITHPAQPKRLITLACGVALTLLALFVAGCGTTTTSLGSSSTATATPTRHLGGGLTVRPCPGPFGSAMTPGNNVVILTGTTANRTASAHVGQTVEVQLPTSKLWHYDASRSASAPLSLVQPAGVEDGQLDLCIWNFTAQAPGTATLAFTGSPLCEPNVPCPAIVLALTFTVNVA